MNGTTAGMRKKERSSKEEGTSLWNDLSMEDHVSVRMSTDYEGGN